VRSYMKRTNGAGFAPNNFSRKRIAISTSMKPTTHQMIWIVRLVELPSVWTAVREVDEVVMGVTDVAGVTGTTGRTGSPVVVSCRTTSRSYESAMIDSPLSPQMGTERGSNATDIVAYYGATLTVHSAYRPAGHLQG